MLLYAIMDSSAMPALSAYCSPEGSVLKAFLHNVGNCLLQRDLPSIGAECQINLSMISLICLEWHVPQVRRASASLSNISQYALTQNSFLDSLWFWYYLHQQQSFFLTSFIFPIFSGYIMICLFWFPSMSRLSIQHILKCSSKYISRSPFLFNGFFDLCKAGCLL